MGERLRFMPRGLWCGATLEAEAGRTGVGRDASADGQVGRWDALGAVQGALPDEFRAWGLMVPWPSMAPFSDVDEVENMGIGREGGWDGSRARAGYDEGSAGGAARSRGIDPRTLKVGKGKEWGRRRCGGEVGSRLAG